MKKFFSLALCAGVFTMASAQLVVSPTGMMDEIGMQAEGMSPDASSYVAGSNQLSNNPTIWDIATNHVKEYVYEGVFYPSLYDEVTWEFIGYDYDNPQSDPYQGTFHAISNSGIAVGEFGSSFMGAGYACKAHVEADTVIWLYSGEEESGSSAYAISDDGNTIAGFYYAGWTAQACVWKNGGLNAEDRIDLPMPSEQEYGGAVDYVSARWMSADASVILGYAQDALNGAWTMVYWTANQDGTYTVHADYANQYFTAYDWEISDFAHPNNAYVRFEPNAISANGEWISLTITPKYDPNDWDATPLVQAARLNLKSNTLEVLDLGETNAPIFFGIANDGTAAGATEADLGPMPMVQARHANASERSIEPSSVRVGYVWPANQNNVFSLQELFANEEEYFNYDETNGEGVISNISADATKIVGYVQKTDGESWEVTSYLATLPAEYPQAISNVENAPKAVKMVRNSQIIISRDGVEYTIMGIKL